MDKFDASAQMALLRALAEVYPAIIPVDEAKSHLPAETAEFNWAYLLGSGLIYLSKEWTDGDRPDDDVLEVKGVMVTAKGIDRLRDQSA